MLYVNKQCVRTMVGAYSVALGGELALRRAKRSSSVPSSVTFDDVN